MKWRLVLALLTLLPSTAALGQSSDEEEFRRRFFSPWGISDTRGIDAFGETLLSPKEREQVGYWLFQQDVLANIAAEKSSEDITKIVGYGVKGVGYGLGALSDAGGLAQSPLMGGVLTVGSAVFGGYLEDYGEHLIEEADEKIAARIAIYLHDEYGGIIRPNGTIDAEGLRAIGDSQLGQLLNDPAFIEAVGNPAILADMKGTITIDMLQVSLRDTQSIKLGVEQLDAQIKELDKGYRTIKDLQSTALRRLQANGLALRGMESKIDVTGSLVATLVKSNVPPNQVLQLVKSGVLKIDGEDLRLLEQTVTAQALKKDFEEAASVFNSLATVFQTLQIDPELAGATQKFAGLLTTGGAFAAAVTLGEPLSIFNSGAALLGSFGSFFGRKGGDNSQKMLAAIFRELRALSEQIQRNHQQQMEALHRIALKIEDLESTMNRRFAELGLDVAALQFDVRELLYEDVQVCERLVDEFALPETQALLARGFVGFGIWYEADNRALDYARCLNGLMARQRVTSETDFSGMLRADSMEEGGQGASITERRNAVRRVEQRILQPTVDYIRKYAETTDGFAVATKIFTPATDICDVQRLYGKLSFDYCPIKEEIIWPPSRLRFSQYNPGQGVLLSAPTAIRMSKMTRIVAPWNGILLDRTTAAAARVISEEEARELSSRTASRRTRHLRSLNAAADSLDLNIAQAQVLAGLPAVPAAAELLDNEIIPAYAKARLLGDPEDLNKLLAAAPPNRSEPGPNCASDDMAKGVADSRAWNTLCAMEANPTFARTSSACSWPVGCMPGVSASTLGAAQSDPPSPVPCWT